MKNAILLIFSIVLRPFVILCGYMINSNSFPKPLSREDEEKYLKLYSEGDENARNILIERNLRLVAHIVKKYSNTGKETEDLISIGTIGLIKAISTYNPAKGTRLATYAARCIENAMRTKCDIVIYRIYQLLNLHHPTKPYLQYPVLNFFFVRKVHHLSYCRTL